MTASGLEPAERSAAGRASRVERVVVAVAALVCLLFAGGLRDVPARAAMIGLYAPVLPATAKDRDAALTVSVVDEDGDPLPGASVRVFAIHGDRAYFAGDRPSDDGGSARFDGLPRGEAWILVYGAGRARASTRVVLGPGTSEVRLALRPAAALDVLVVDEADHAVTGADVRVFGGDPLPAVATTGSDGLARFDRLGAGPFAVRARALGYEEASRTGVHPTPAPLRIKLERLGALIVSVVDGDGKPAAGATVLAAGSGLWPARSTTTDEAGRARIGGLRAGVYDLKARLGDQVSPTELAVPLKRGEEREVRLALEVGRRVTVTVTDGAGEPAIPIAGASVVLVEEGLSPFPLNGKTNEEGRVTLGPIAAGPASAGARAKGFVARGAVPIAELETEVRVPLLRGGALIGDVVDDRGYPVDGATIEVVGVDLDGMPIDEVAAVSEFREGHFDMALAGPRPLIPMGELGVMPGPIPDLPREGALLESAFERAPLGGGSDTSVPALATGRGDEPWVTRRDGTFRAEPVPPGRVHAIVRHPSYLEATSETVSIAPGGEATVHVVLHQGGVLLGRVVEADRTPVAGARVELAASRGSLERVTYAADDGTFAFAAVPDEVVVSVARPDAPGDVAARLIIEVPERERKEIEIMLPRVREKVAIHVVDDRGYPLDRVEVRALALDPEEPLRRTLFTNDDGDAELPNAYGLPLRFTLVRPGKAPQVTDVELAPAELTFEMKQGIRAKGTVTAREGRDRVAGADVTLYARSGARHAMTDDEGDFAVDDLAAGRVRVVVSHAEHATRELLVTVADDPDHGADLGELDLTEAGEATGLVVDEHDDPVPGARVARDSVPTWLPLGPLPPGVVTTDRDGRFTLGGLPEGDVTLGAYSADLGRGWSEPVPIRAGRTTSRVKIALSGDAAGAREAKGAGSVAVTLGERAGAVVVVLMVPPGSEAELAGVEPGDQILAVNGREVRSLEEARRRLTGPLSEDVIVKLARSVEGAPPTWLARVRRERVRR